LSQLNQTIRVWSIIFLIGILCLLSGGGVVQAQSPKPGAVTINYLEANIDDYGQPAVSAYVSVVSDTGQPLTDLQQSNFEVMEDGVEMLVDSVSIASDPISVILVMDTSGSMAAVEASGQMALESAKQAAVSFISNLAPGDQVAVYSFNDEVVRQQDLSPDHNAAINAINFLNYKDFGGTCLYDAAVEAVKKSAETLQGRRAILVLTDGVDEASQSDGPCSVSTLDDVIDKATQDTIKAPIFTIGFGKVDEPALQRIARRTGGRSLIADNASELSGLFNTIAAQLKNQYLVTYQTQAVSGEHTVVVKAQLGNGYESDERRVFIPPSLAPEPVSPTPAPPQVSASIVAANKDQPLPGELEIVVNILPPEQVTEAALYVDDGLEQKLLEPPFDRFILNLDELTPGQHILRLEVLDSAGQTTVARRDLDIAAQPTFTPQPAPIPDPAPASNEIDPRLLIAGVAAGIIVLIIIVAAVILYFWRKPNPVDPSSGGGEIKTDDHFITQDSVNQFVTFDSGDEADDQYKTRDGILTPLPQAWLEVIRGVNVEAGERFEIKKRNVTIGRSEGGAVNDLDLPETAVSRNHAEIRFREDSFSILDRNSRYHTFVNGQQVSTEVWEPIRHGDKIKFGTRTVMEFKAPSTATDNSDVQQTVVSGEQDFSPSATSDAPVVQPEE